MKKTTALKSNAASAVNNLRRKVLRGGAGFSAFAALTSLFPLSASAVTRELRIGYQKGLLSLLKGRGTLEKRLAPLGVSIKWIEFSAGPVQLEALSVGSIDFGDVGEAPRSFRRRQVRRWSMPRPRCRVRDWKACCCRPARRSSRWPI